MTQPGHPDGQDYATWADAPLTSGSNTVPVGSLSLGPFLVTNYASMFISGIASADPAALDVAYYQDEACTELVESWNFNLGNVTATEVIVPNLGAYVLINLSNAGSEPIDISLTAVPVNIPVTGPTYPASGNYVISGFATALAGASNAYPLPLVALGPAFWWFMPSDTTGELDFQIATALNVTPSQALVFVAKAPAAPVSGIIYLTDIPMQVIVKNNDASNPHSYRVSLMVGGK